MKVNLNKPVKILFPEKVELVKQGKCAFCEKKINMDDFKDELSKKEYGISGLCFSCQDKVF